MYIIHICIYCMAPPSIMYVGGVIPIIHQKQIHYESVVLCIYIIYVFDCIMHIYLFAYLSKYIYILYIHTVHVNMYGCIYKHMCILYALRDSAELIQ